MGVPAKWLKAEADAKRVPCLKAAAHNFGSSLGDRTADTLLAELRQVPEVGLTRTQMLHDVFHKNKTAGDIADALRLLNDNGLAYRKDDPAPEVGRGAERWFATLTT